MENPLKPRDPGEERPESVHPREPAWADPEQAGAWLEASGGPPGPFEEPEAALQSLRILSRDDQDPGFWAAFREAAGGPPADAPPETRSSDLSHLDTSRGPAIVEAATPRLAEPSFLPRRTRPADERTSGGTDVEAPPETPRVSVYPSSDDDHTSDAGGWGELLRLLESAGDGSERLESPRPDREAFRLAEGPPEPVALPIQRSRLPADDDTVLGYEALAPDRPRQTEPPTGRTAAVPDEPSTAPDSLPGPSNAAEHGAFWDRWSGPRELTGLDIPLPSTEPGFPRTGDPRVDPGPSARARPQRRKIDRARVVLQDVLLVLVVFLSFRASAQTFQVDGQSMFPTLRTGQLLLVNKLVYKDLPVIDSAWFLFHAPERGDVVVLRDPRRPDEDLVKRIVGLPGETIELRDGRVYVNDRLLEEPYVTATWHDTKPKIVIPDGHYFVMGDNRPASLDSRSLGPVSSDLIIGKMSLRYWPLSTIAMAANVPGGPEGPHLTETPPPAETR